MPNLTSKEISLQHRMNKTYRTYRQVQHKLLVRPQIYGIVQSTRVLVLQEEQNIMFCLISKILYDMLLCENVFNSLNK